MRFNYNTHPVLRMIDEGKLGKIRFYEEDSHIPKNAYFIDKIKNRFYSLAPNLRQNIYSITKPFAASVANAMDKLIKEEALQIINFESGVILDYNFFGQTISILYEFKKGTIPKFLEFTIYFFKKDVFLAYFESRENKDLVAYYYSSVFIDSFPSELKIEANYVKSEMCSSLLLVVLSYILFIKYANVETKYLNAGQKIKEIDCKYLNETKSQVNILSSTWFTNLVKSDAFKVRGHFRLQPCGEGMKDRKLIWISDFQKEGYNRQADKLKTF